MKCRRKHQRHVRVAVRAENRQGFGVLDERKRVFNISMCDRCSSPCPTVASSFCRFVIALLYA